MSMNFPHPKVAAIGSSIRVKTGPTRPDLLLCGHYNRASGRAPTAAKAAVLNIDGSPHDRQRIAVLIWT